MNPVLENLKAVVEIIAYAGAAEFFGWKVAAGYLVVNLAVSVKLSVLLRPKETTTWPWRSQRRREPSAVFNSMMRALE